MMTDTVTRSLVIGAPRADVWRAVTEPAQLVKWLAPNLPGAELTLEADGRVVVHMGPMGIDLATLHILEPQRAAAMRGLPDQQLTITYALADEGASTRLTVTLGGLEALPAAARADRLGLAGDAWDQALPNLAAAVAGADLPFPQAHIAPLFGYWRAPENQLAIERSIWIKAPPARVWQALVDPQLFQQWFSPTTPWVLTAAAVGGRLYVVDPETKAELYTSVIETFDAPSRLALRHPADAPGAHDKRTVYTLTDENGGTRLTLLYLGYELDEADMRWAAMEQTTFGFGMMLQNIKAVLEDLPLPMPGGF